MSKIGPVLSKVVIVIAFLGLVASLSVVIHSWVTGQGLQAWPLATAVLLTAMLLQRLFCKR